MRGHLKSYLAVEPLDDLFLGELSEKHLGVLFGDRYFGKLRLINFLAVLFGDK